MELLEADRRQWSDRRPCNDDVRCLLLEEPPKINQREKMGNQLKVLVLGLCFILASRGLAFGESSQLKVLYIDYPPYYTTTADGQPRGLIVDIARRVFARAGVEATFSCLPSKRVILAMEEGAPVASLGWFKTAEREKFAQFSLPVYVNKPVEVVMLHSAAAKFAPFTSLKDLVASRQLSIGRIDGHSEGTYLDRLLVNYSEQTVWVTEEKVRLIRMLKNRRFDFTLLPPEEVEVLVEASGLAPSEFARQTMSDIPLGNARHIMYSRTIDPALITRIDAAIAKEVGDVLK